MAEGGGARVLQLLGPSAGGIRRHVGALAAALGDRGWGVEVAGPKNVMEGVGPQHHTVAVPDGLSVCEAWSARRVLGHLAARFDLVHAHGLKAGWLAAARRRRPPVVVTVHNLVLDEAGRAARVLRVLEQALPARADAVVAVSAEIARRFAGAARADRVTVVPPVGPVTRARRPRDEVRAALGAADGVSLVVSVARLHPQKDLPTLLRAAALLRDRHRDVRFAVVGAGPERARLDRLVVDLGLADRVRLAGESANAADELAAADVVVLPSLWEGAPLTVVEAMRAGRPVVATAVGAVPEVVVDGVTGRLVPPRDPAGLAAAISELLADPVAAERMGARGRERIAERYDADALVGAVEAVYRQVLA